MCLRERNCHSKNVQFLFRQQLDRGEAKLMTRLKADLGVINANANANSALPGVSPANKLLNTAAPEGIKTRPDGAPKATTA